jgi:hypothetical protein
MWMKLVLRHHAWSKVFVGFNVLIGAVWPGPVHACFELTGTRQVAAQLSNSTGVQIGEVMFAPAPGGLIPVLIRDGDYAWL